MKSNYKIELKKIFYYLASFALFASSSFTDANAIQLNEAILNGLATSSKLAAALKRSDSQKSAAFGSVAPRFLPTASFSYTESSSPDQFWDGERSNKMYTLNITQPIPVFSLIRDAHATSTAMNAANVSFIAERDALAMSIVDVYCEVLRTKNVYSLKINEHNIFHKHFEIAEKKFSLGEINKKEFLSVKARMLSASATMRKAKTDLEFAQIKYEHIVGSKPVDVQMPKEASYAYAMPKTLSEAETEVFKNDSEIKSALVSRQINASQLTAAYTELLPKIDLSLTMNHNAKCTPLTCGINPKTRSFDKETGSSAAITFTVPIFQSGTIANIAVSHDKYSESLFSYYEAVKNSKERLLTIWNGIESSEDLIRASSESLSALKLALEATQVASKLNLTDITSLLDAEKDVISSEVDMVNLKIAKLKQQYTLATLTGRLDKILFSKKPRTHTS